MASDARIRWLLVEDHSSVASAILGEIGRLRPTFQHLDPAATSVDEALVRIHKELPDVVVVDLELPPKRAAESERSRKFGWELAAAIRTTNPAIKVLIWSGKEPDPNSSIDRDGVHNLGLNFSGYLTKGHPAPLLATAIEGSVGGRTFFDQDILDRLWKALRKPVHPCLEQYGLNAEEHRTLVLLSDKGWENNRLATELQREVKAIESRISSCLQKLPACDNRSQLIIWMHRNCPEVS